MVCDVVSDVLELYIRFRAKEEGMGKESWVELLDITFPRLKVTPFSPNNSRRHHTLVLVALLCWLRC